jgi:hypothetical protein
MLEAVAEGAGIGMEEVVEAVTMEAVEEEAVATAAAVEEEEAAVQQFLLVME